MIALILTDETGKDREYDLDPTTKCGQYVIHCFQTGASFNPYKAEFLKNENMVEELRACRLLLADPRVRALFPPLPDGAVLASCSGPVYSQAVPDCIEALQEALDETKKSNSPTVKLPTWDAEEIIRRYGK